MLSVCGIWTTSLPTFSSWELEGQPPLLHISSARPLSLSSNFICPLLASLFSHSLPLLQMAAKRSIEPTVSDEQDLLETHAPEPGYASRHWCSMASRDFLLLLITTYRIPYIVSFEISKPQEGTVDVGSSASHVALFPSVFSYVLSLPFPRLVHKVLHHLGLAPTQLHLSAWRILICCCVLW